MRSFSFTQFVFHTALVYLSALAACSGDDRHAGDGTQGPGTQAGNEDLIAPQFPGAGESGAGESIGAGLETVSCGSDDPSSAPAESAEPGEKVSILCFFSAEGEVAATVEWVVETAADDELVHIRLTLDPHFADNSYGDEQIGWIADADTAADPMAMEPMMMMMKPKMAKGHTFMDLVGSDHAQMQLTDADGNVVLEFKADYVSEDPSSPSGYSSLGVTGGEGQMIVGDASDVVEVSTSIDRNLNLCGYSEYLESSPPSNEDFAASADAPNWDYRVVYDVWVKRDAFGDAGFGQALIENVHASPSKVGENTVDVTPGPCPPEWCLDDDGCDGVIDPPPGDEPPCNDLDDNCGAPTDPQPDAGVPCNDLDDGCGGDGMPPPTPVDCDVDPEAEGCDMPD